MLPQVRPSATAAGEPGLRLQPRRDALSLRVGPGAADGNVGATGPAAARRALLDNVLPFYNTVRFNFGFTQDELKDLAEFILSL